MIAFVLWFALLVAMVKFTNGWTRGILVTFYILASILIVL